ncbi:MAG: 50S ribosomal protein L28 [Alphaproteobacteria bacterium]
MTRKCGITQRGVQTGNNVSHANNKVKRRFLPNLQKASFPSEALGSSVQFRVSARGIRTIEKNGGIDTYLTGMNATKLSAEARQLKKRIEKAAASKA